MKKLIAILALAFALPVMGTDIRDQNVSSTNPTAAVSTALSAGDQYAVYCTAAVRYRTCETSTCAAVATDMPIAGATTFDIPLPNSHRYLSVRSESGTASCEVYKVYPKQARP